MRVVIATTLGLVLTAAMPAHCEPTTGPVARDVAAPALACPTRAVSAQAASSSTPIAPGCLPLAPSVR